MLQIIKTTYRNGVFVPNAPVDLPEGTETEIVVEKANSNFHNEDIKQKQSINEFIERVSQRTILADAPKKITREELHERR